MHYCFLHLKNFLPFPSGIMFTFEAITAAIELLTPDEVARFRA